MTLPFRSLHHRLRRLEANAADQVTDSAEWERIERIERDRRRTAYLRTPAGAKLERRIVVLIRQWQGALDDKRLSRERPDLFTRDPCPRCGDRFAGPHMCGPKRDPDEVYAEIEAAYAEADRQTEAWLASGATAGA